MTYPAEWTSMDTVLLVIAICGIARVHYERYRDKQHSGNLTSRLDTGCQPEKSWNA
jgi:hypothetical protein